VILRLARRGFRVAAALFVLGAAFAGPSLAESPADSAAVLNAAAIQAYQAKDYASFLANEKRALAWTPENQRLMYNVACGEALTGDADAAVKMLDRLLEQKCDFGAERDGDFDSIRATPAWTGYASRLAELRKPMVRSEVAFRLADSSLIATGVAVDVQSGDTFISSVRQRKVLRRERGGAISDFTHPAEDSLRSAVSVLVDARRRLLYVSTASPPFMVGYRAEDFGRCGVFAYDLGSGRLVRKAMLRPDGRQHFLNQLALDRDGNLYVSDSAVPGIYVLRRGSDSLATFFTGNGFRSTQGLAFSDDERTLYVADWSDGLWAVDVKSKQRRRLEAPPGTWLAGLDGLSRVKDGFISVQLGVQPNRVLHVRLDAAGTSIAGVDILEMSHPDYSSPIQGTVVGQSFLYVANSQLDLADDRTGTFPFERARPAVVLRLPL
jgi:sugar lactone lactonase YvrE